MKKVILYIISFLLLPASEVFAQGFDWQVSSRVPYDVTQKYIGLTGNFSTAIHTGEFPFLEDEVQCCTYENGTGNSFGIGLVGEYWIQPDLALAASLKFDQKSSLFYTETTIAKSPEIDWTTAYESSITLSYLNLDILAKKRLFLDYFSIKGGLGFNYNISNSGKHKNIVVSPDNLPFSDGSFEKELPNGKISEINTFVIDVKGGAAYDFNLGLERYGELSLNAAYNINSLLADHSWHDFRTFLELKIYMGI